MQLPCRHVLPYMFDIASSIASLAIANDGKAALHFLAGQTITIQMIVKARPHITLLHPTRPAADKHIQTLTQTKAHTHILRHTAQLGNLYNKADLCDTTQKEHVLEPVQMKELIPSGATLFERMHIRPDKLDLTSERLRP